MKHEAEIKELLISNTIRLVAKGGFEIATTKELTHSGGQPSAVRMNEVYIYRLFGSKEKLYDSAFAALDLELYNAFFDGLRIVGKLDVETRERMQRFFVLAWEFVLGNEERCRCYVRFFYSIYFKGECLAAHNDLFGGMINAVKPLFKAEADVASILHTVFIALFNFAIRVYNGELSDSEDTRYHVFNVLYCMAATYLK